MDLIPAVDVLNGKVVRLRQGREDDVTVYGSDPAAQVRAWKAQGASLVHVVDLSGAIEGTWNGFLWRELGETGVCFQAGGGIRSIEAAIETVEGGADRVVLGSTAVWNPTLLASIVEILGPDRVVAAVDVRDGRAVGTGWTDGGRPLDQMLDELAGAGVTRALVTGIAGDGMLSGPAIDLFHHCAHRVPAIGIIASGGVGNLGDLRRLRSLPLEGVIVGRALYEGAFTLTEGLEVLA
ncbi:MAG TPA: 1-(5-phosphoribosyl)-5-[(5-phosphoribosylamino)methylideneamino] imidazole-4-carboxamide isomerase [Acidimicrobiia bacterium]|nr:1-(5-phosphoribosyl)-5-[(5-phosphoribosylamino)methylideneamino] imidazole-4-carboxamide isomerase [Acidimicrobiia bacterium]